MNISQIFILGVAATFPWVRRLIGVLGLIAVAVAAHLITAKVEPVTVAAVNNNPTCNRFVWFTPSEQRVPAAWGDFIRTPTETYVREAKGTGFCRVKFEPEFKVIDGLYVRRWYEVPSKYGDIVAASIPATEPPPNFRAIIGIFVGMFGLGLIGIWLISTIMAAVARRWINNIKDDDSGEVAL